MEISQAIYRNRSLVSLFSIKGLGSAVVDGDGVGRGGGGTHPGVVGEPRGGRPPPLPPQAVGGRPPLPGRPTWRFLPPARPFRPHSWIPLPSVSTASPFRPRSISLLANWFGCIPICVLCCQIFISCNCATLGLQSSLAKPGFVVIVQLGLKLDPVRNGFRCWITIIFYRLELDLLRIVTDLFNKAFTDGVGVYIRDYDFDFL